MSETISYKVEDNIAFVSIIAKTMTPVFFAECESLFEDINGRADIRTVVIKSQNSSFSYGLDLKSAMQEFTNLGPMARQRHVLLKTIRNWQRAFSVIAECPVPVIAAIHGYCIGGGLDLISACDIRLASSDAVFSLRETKMAIVADLGSLQRLPAIIGKSALAEMAYTGKDVDATWAKDASLVNEVMEDRESLEIRVGEIAKEIALNSPITIRGVKEVLSFGEDNSVDAGLEYVAAWNSAFLMSKDLTEAMTAFMTKKTAKFEGLEE